MPSHPRITSGATLRDVAEQAGVSVSTASRALSGSRPVSAGLAGRVREAARSLGYRANVGARNLRLSRTMTLGLIYERMDTPAYLDFLEGMIATADQHGYSIIVSNADGDPRRYGELVHRAYEQRVEGLLLSTPRGVRRDLEPFVAAGVPTLALFGRDEQCADIPVVTVPEGRTTRAGMMRLRELGHRRVIYLSSESSLADRWRFIEPAARSAGIEPLNLVIPDDLQPDQHREHLQGLLTEHRDATVVFAHGRDLGGLVSAMARLGEGTPRDRSIVTFTDSRHTLGLIDPPLTSIHVDTVEFGERAIDLLEAWIGGVAPANVSRLDLATWEETASVGPAPAR